MPLSITTAGLPNAVIGKTYLVTLAATGGTPPYTWSISAGSLPGWATLSGSTGVTSGTATGVPATTSFTVEVTDNASGTATQPLSIVTDVFVPGQPGPVRAAAKPPPAGRAGSSNPGGPSGGGGINSSAGIYYSLQTGAQSGGFGPFNFPQIQGGGIIGPITVTNDVWNPPTPGTWTQQLYVANPAEFIVIANMPANSGSVKSYPSSGITCNNLLLQNFTSHISSFAEVQPAPATPGVASEAAYDTWWNDYANEIMMQHDMIDSSNLRGGFPILLTATFGGSYGVPVHNWNLGIFGAEIIWQLADGVVDGVGGIQQGSIDYRAMMNWLADRGYLQNGLASTFSGFGYGWEICSTNGQEELYRCSGFTSTYTYSPMETSPGLELYGFTISGPRPQDTINNVMVEVTEYQSSIQAQPCTIQLWDYSGTPAQIGTTQLGARSTSNSNVSSATFYTVTYAQLATLRVRVSGNAASGYIESVGGVSLSVNYTPFNTNAGYSVSMGTG